RVVFATAYERYAVQAFEVHSIDYLLKPFDRVRFGATLARVRDEMRKSVPAEEKLDALLREIRESTQALRGAAAGSAPEGAAAGAVGADDEDEEPTTIPPGSPSAPRTSSDRISGRRGQRIYLLAPHEILWFEAEGELVFAKVGAHRYHVSRTLAELEASLDPKQFFRSHRSFIVNLAAIAEIVPEDSGN